MYLDNIQLQTGTDILEKKNRKITLTLCKSHIIIKIIE